MERIILVAEAATPHNNYFFSVLSRDPEIDLELNYIFRSDNFPGWKWKTLTKEIEGAVVRDGIGRWFQYDLLRRALLGKDIFFIIGWNQPLLVMLIFILGLRKKPLFMWFDTPNPQSTSFFLWRLLKKFCISAINRSQGSIFVTGKLAHTALKKMGIIETKLQCLPFFTDASIKYLDETRSDKIESDCRSITLVAAGRFIHSKGYDVLIAALNLLYQRLSSGWTVILVGSGPEETFLVEQIKRYNLKSVVQLVPWSEPEQYTRLMSLADIFVAPARFDPFPTTVLLAMQLGKAVIATYGVGSAVEFIETGFNGLLVEQDNIDQLADAMEMLVRSADSCNKLGNCAMNTLDAWPAQRGVEIIKRELTQLENR